MSMVDDRDLVLIEPTLFIDAENQATRLVHVIDGSVSNTSVTSLSADFEAAQVDAGHVVVVNNEVCEVVDRMTAAALTVSLPRANEGDPLIEPAQGSGMTVTVATFMRLIDQVEVWVLGSLGIADEDPETTLDEEAILNPADVQRLIALKTIARAFEAAAALDPADESLASRAMLYRDAATDASGQTRAILDLDGDGIADATRRFDVAVLRRI